MRPLAWLCVVVGVLWHVDANGQDRTVADLKNPPPQQRVTAIGHCRSEYDVFLGDGTSRKFREYDLAFKVDSSAQGPVEAKPVLVPTGRVGDRAFVVFATIEELRSAMRAECRE